jgi:hypothetical protein
MYFKPFDIIAINIDDRLAQWSEYSPIAQEVASSIPAQYKHLCAWTCLLVLGLGVCYVYYVCIYKKKYISIFIYPLSRIHNTSLASAYFGLDKRECGCLEYLFIYILLSSIKTFGFYRRRGGKRLISCLREKKSISPFWLKDFRIKGLALTPEIDW